jgi:hypothetical protein
VSPDGESSSCEDDNPAPPSRVGNDCTDNSDCGPGLECVEWDNGPDGPESKCWDPHPAPPDGVGQMCTSDGDCLNGLSCIYDTSDEGGGQFGTCQRWPRRHHH